MLMRLEANIAANDIKKLQNTGVPIREQTLTWQSHGGGAHDMTPDSDIAAAFCCFW